jgi:hypothetical protein
MDDLAAHCGEMKKGRRKKERKWQTSEEPLARATPRRRRRPPLQITRATRER